MELKNVDILKLCPAFMREDKTNQILAQGCNNLFQRWAQNAERLVIVNQIDNLSAAELDQLAKDTNIFWYNESANISVKRAIIKNSPIVFNRLGTVWAVESVMNDYLPDSELQEWFDYKGTEGYFRLVTNNTEILTTDFQIFLNVLDATKRKSQWLEDVILKLEQQLTLYPAFGVVETTHEEYVFSAYLLKNQIHNVMTKSAMEQLTKDKYCEVRSV